MGAKPSIVSATGYRGNGNDIWLLCLYENKESMGYTRGTAKFQGSRYDSGTNMCNQDISNARISCINPTKYNLKNGANTLVNLGAPFNFACLESFGCSGGDDCAARTCSTWGNRVSFVWDIPIVTQNWNPPSNPGPVTVTPGNATLTIAWNKVADPVGLPEVFSYYIVIIDPAGEIVASGFMEAGTKSVTIGGLTNGKKYTVEVMSISHNDVNSSLATGTGTPVGATNPYVYNILTIPDAPAAGASFGIEAQIANTGPSGKVRAVFKVGGTQISDQESTLVTFQDPGRVLWKPTATSTMPNATTTITVEAYGWDGSKWVLTDTKSITRTPSVTPCSGVTLTPFSASIKAGGKVTFVAAVTPATTAYDVEFKDRVGTLLGTCKSLGGSCTFIWDSAGKPAGTYYIKASVAQGSCSSTESVIQISPEARQWNVSIYVRDSATGNPVVGATVTIGSQSKATDATGLAIIRVNEGTISISISKTGYSTRTEIESAYADKTLNYSLTPSGAATGSLLFVTIPTAVSIYLDNVLSGTTDPSTGVLLIQNLTAGKTMAYTAKKSGYNDSTGSATVVSGIATTVPVTLTPITPGTGALCIKSNPDEAAVFIDGAATGKVTALSGTGCLSRHMVTGIVPGTHEYRIVLKGYADKTGTVKITTGQTLIVDAGTMKKAGIGAGVVVAVGLLGAGAIGTIIYFSGRK